MCDLDPADARVFLIIRRSTEPRGERVRVAPGLMGKYIGWVGDDAYNVEVKAADLRRLLAKVKP